MKTGNMLVEKAARNDYTEFQRFIKSLRTQRQLWLLSIPIIIWVIIFAYYPMYGILMAFFDYTPGKEIFQCDFTGLKYFKQFVTNPSIFTLLRNTLVMSGLSLTLGFLAPIVFSLMLNEMGRSGVKKVIQTVSYLPHFISWIVAGSMVYMVLSSDGILNSLLSASGATQNSIPFLTKGEYYWTIYIIVNVWKSVGWSSIIYLSAMSGVDEELYQSGAIDGLGRWGMVKHITLPSIAPTIILLWILGIGNILSAGFDYHLIIGNAATRPYWDVIDTYAYRYGVQQGYYSMGTAVSLMKSVIGFVLVWITNSISKKMTDTSIF
ncbi:MAG: protein lplB [Eubacterium sp.]|jgi:putative aldouronate transport system permease protein|nr:protein lplB [Eubacterium sp.]